MDLSDRHRVAVRPFSSSLHAGGLYRKGRGGIESSP
jgi:hypothetical protein